MEFKPGEKVLIKGTIYKAEVYPNGEILYYCSEDPETAIKESDLVHVNEIDVYIEEIDEFTKKLEQFAAVIEKARSMYEDLAHFDMKVNSRYKRNGKFVTTELAHLFANLEESQEEVPSNATVIINNHL